MKKRGWGGWGVEIKNSKNLRGLNGVVCVCVCGCLVLWDLKGVKRVKLKVYYKHPGGCIRGGGGRGDGMNGFNKERQENDYIIHTNLLLYYKHFLRPYFFERNMNNKDDNIKK